MGRLPCSCFWKAISFGIILSLSKSILAVIVTHNRAPLLSRCLDYLQRQARHPEEIVVINNGSTDGTESMLRNRKIRCINQDNVGSAGGWHRGIRVALDEGFDAVWLMDDDGFPDKAALERLEARLTGNIVSVSSAVLCEGDQGRFVFPLPRLNRQGLPVLFARKRKLLTLADAVPVSEDGLYPFAHFFNGTLILTNAIQKIGNVNCDFFIFGDELDYLYRLRKTGLVYTVLSAHHYHPAVEDRALTDAKIYYYVKNTLILNRRYFDWAGVRNVLTVVVAVVRVVRRNGWRTALTFVAGAKRHLLWTAIVRGLRGQVAKDFRV